MAKLHPRHMRFVSEYMIDFDKNAAARRAGYSKSDPSCGFKLMARYPQIVEEVERQCLKIQIRLELSADDVRRGIARIATDPRDVAAGGPSFRDRLAAWVELGKLFGMYQHKIQVTGSLTLVDLLLAADKQTREIAVLPAPVAEAVH